MKKILPLVLLALLTVSAASAATPKAASSKNRVGIAAIVNDDVVTISDVDSRVKLYMAGGPQKPPAEALKKLEQQIVSRLIDEKLQLQEAKELGISVSEEQVGEGFAEIARQNGQPAEIFKERMQKAGIKVESLLDQIRAEIAWSLVIKRKLRPQVNVSESEIDNEMDQLARSYGKTEYRVAEIFLNVPGPKDEPTVKAGAEKIVKEITKGASFAQIARQSSQSPGASTGGDIGWVQEGQLGGNLDAALAQMQPGQVSPPIRTDKGYYILFLRDVRQNAAQNAVVGKTPDAPSSAPSPETTLALKQIVIPVAQNEPAPVLNAKIVRAQSLKTEISSCEAMTEASKNFAGEGTRDLGERPLSELQEPVKSAVADLAVGILSAPVRVQEGIAVLMVCARQEAPPGTTAESPLPKISGVEKTDEASREKIAGKIGQQRLTQLQERYLRDLRATAFIDKRL